MDLLIPSNPVPKSPLVDRYQKEQASVRRRIHRRGSSEHTAEMERKLDAEALKGWHLSKLHPDLKTEFLHYYKEQLLGVACTICTKAQPFSQWPELVGTSSKSMLLYLVNKGLINNTRCIEVEEFFRNALKISAEAHTNDLKDGHALLLPDGKNAYEGAFTLSAPGQKDLNKWAGLYAWVFTKEDLSMIQCGKTDFYGLTKLSPTSASYIFTELESKMRNDIESKMAVTLYDYHLPRKQSKRAPLKVFAPVKVSMNYNMWVDTVRSK